MGDYGYQIYNLLYSYLPSLNSANNTQADNSGIIAGLVEEIRDYVAQIPDLLSSIQIDTADISKFLLWFLIAFLSTKIIRWGFRI